MKAAGWCSLVIGVLMLGQWVFFLSMGQVPEVRTAPIALGFHLAAEAITALLLVVSGTMLIRGRSQFAWLGFVANGMLMYTVIVSPGYFAQLGQWSLVAMFAVLLGLATFSIWQLLRVITGADPAS